MLEMLWNSCLQKLLNMIGAKFHFKPSLTWRKRKHAEENMRVQIHVAMAQMDKKFDKSSSLMWFGLFSHQRQKQTKPAVKIMQVQQLIIFSEMSSDRNRKKPEKSCYTC